MDLNSLARHARRLSSAGWIPRLRLVYIYAVAVVLGLFLFVGFGGVGRLRRIPRIASPTLHGTLQRNSDLSLPDAPFVAWPLAGLCRETSWTPGLVFACSNNSGGIGNIRNFVLTCLRYALAAGATGLVLPEIQTRSEDNLAQLFGGRQPFGYFFDEAHFRRGLREACPAITVYDNTAAVPHLAPRRAEPLEPKALGLRGGCDHRDVNRHTDMFRTRFDALLAETAADFHLPPVSAVHPRLFQPVWGVQWEWPVAKDGPALANTFGGLLRFRRDLLQLGDAVAAAMAKTGGAQFAGVHLRTESDALAFWPTFETQTSAFLKTLLAERTHAVYLATGNATEAAKFAERAREQGIRVVTKDALLDRQPTLAQQLPALTWDQQAVVDFVVLVRSAFFLGVSPSSFSMTIAAKRHLRADTQTDGVYARPWPVNERGDARSRLVGNYTSYWDDWLFMLGSTPVYAVPLGGSMPYM
ncbi:hypothetical protein SPBR_00551 [Sporothrix brasiliensis 5110]|uniref:Alternative oxidase n=1 Tax=Sporothrix brasiliensis 5110 TaxID=1398154 RepID=A0A0C2ETN9_9PEZI|nr:uncharacterized protein SPBR_00551 [Sporothrix brasiliensis 5110]KIH89889.1 hypothetical protein SPBR_00551 [Sporothrix brasiliensis 5110]